jgi:hypothetical protein
MPSGDELVAVYFGGDTDSIFLKSLLEGSGIPASIRNFSESDVERAQPLVEHFKQHGQKSPRTPWG